MATITYVTVDVFTEHRFGGNPLAVFPDARGLDEGTMQALAAELNYSESTFVLPPDDPGNTARVRIFNRTAEMPFAGHPNVGTAFALRSLGLVNGPVLRFEEIAGLVEVRLSEVGAEIDAPQPLTEKAVFPLPETAACLGLSSEDVDGSVHPPVQAGVGIDFVLVAISREALARAEPDPGSFRRLLRQFPSLGARLSILGYAVDGPDVRARMFAPLSGTWEDPATGSANAALAALRLRLSGEETLSYRAIQGREIGRESHMSLRAWRTPGGVRASVGGACAMVFCGSVEL